MLTIEPSKTNFEEGQFRMPVLLDIEGSDSEDEMIAIGAGQYRRKSPGQGKDWMAEGEANGSGDERKAAANGTSRSATTSKRRRAEA